LVLTMMGNRGSWRNIAITLTNSSLVSASPPEPLWVHGMLTTIF
jgi:hypothetical protein